MEALLEILAEGVLALLGKVTRRCGRKTQIVVDILVAAGAVLAVGGYCVWRAVYHWCRGEFLIAGIFALVVVASVLLGFITIRRIVRNNK